MLKGTIRRDYMKAATYGTALLLTCTSCIYDSYVDTPGDGEDGVSISLTIRTSPLEETISYTEEQGSTYENYIDLTGTDYRIYFFTDTAADGNDTFLMSFNPVDMDMVPIYGTNYTEYTVYGTAPEDLTAYSNFKIVMLANWGEEHYMDDDDLTEATTISQICSPPAEAEQKGIATFGVYANAVGESTTEANALSLSLAEGRLIPFYGVNTYENITFTKGKSTILSEPLTLLRAMAKVEVVIDCSEVSGSIDDVRLCRYNSKGYCAPVAYQRSDYDYSYAGYTSLDLHLVNGYNDYDESVGTPVERYIHFLKTQEATTENGNKEIWDIYVPEYKNTSSSYENDYAYIAIYLKYEENVEGPNYVYFAHYADGETDNTDMSNRFDIQRNHLYRFNVTIDELYRVWVSKWDNTYHNNFELGESSSAQSEDSDDEGTT